MSRPDYVYLIEELYSGDYYAFTVKYEMVRVLRRLYMGDNGDQLYAYRLRANASFASAVPLDIEELVNADPPG